MYSMIYTIHKDENKYKSHDYLLHGGLLVALEPYFSEVTKCFEQIGLKSCTIGYLGFTYCHIGNPIT